MNDISLLSYRDLSGVRTEVSKFVRVAQGACLELDNDLREMDSKKERNQQEMVIILCSNAVCCLPLT